MSPHENEPMSQKRRLTGGVWPAPPLSKSTTQKAHKTSAFFSPGWFGKSWDADQMEE